MRHRDASHFGSAPAPSRHVANSLRLAAAMCKAVSPSALRASTLTPAAVASATRRLPSCCSSKSSHGTHLPAAKWSNVLSWLVQAAKWCSARRLPCSRASNSMDSTSRRSASGGRGWRYPAQCCKGWACTIYLLTACVAAGLRQHVAEGSPARPPAPPPGGGVSSDCGDPCSRENRPDVPGCIAPAQDGCCSLRPP